MTSDEILEAARNLGVIPDTGSLGAGDTDLLAHADHGISTYLLPRLMNMREDFFVLHQRTPISAARVRLPSRCSFNKLSDVYLWDGSRRSRLNKVDLSELADDAFASPAYVLEGNSILLVPEDSLPTGSLEFVFYGRPGSLTLVENARRVISVDTDAGEIIIDSAAPAAWVSGTKLDCHSFESGAELLLWDAQITTGAGLTTLTFSTAIDGSIYGTQVPQTGDYIVLAGKAAVPALPVELHPLIARAACIAIAEATGDTSQVKLHGAVLDRFFGESGKAMETRVDNRPVPLGGMGPIGGRFRLGPFINHRA